MLQDMTKSLKARNRKRPKATNTQNKPASVETVVEETEFVTKPPSKSPKKDSPAVVSLPKVGDQVKVKLAASGVCEAKLVGIRVGKDGHKEYRVHFNDERHKRDTWWRAGTANNNVRF